MRLDFFSCIHDIDTCTYSSVSWECLQTGICGLTATKIIGPLFCEDPETGAAITITIERYFAMLEHGFQDEQNSDVWFKQDGAPAHTSLMAIEWLNSRSKTT